MAEAFGEAAQRARDGLRPFALLFQVGLHRLDELDDLGVLLFKPLDVRSRARQPKPRRRNRSLGGNDRRSQRCSPAVAARMFDALAKNKINIQMISTSDLKICCVIERRHAETALRVLHKAFALETGGGRRARAI